jgi:hypothetical protein
MSHTERETWVQVTIRECKYEGETDQPIYADLNMLQLTDMDEELIEPHLSISLKYHSTNTCAVTYNQMDNNLTYCCSYTHCGSSTLNNNQSY